MHRAINLLTYQPDIQQLCQLRYQKLRYRKLTPLNTPNPPTPSLQPPLLSLGKALSQTRLMLSATFRYTSSAHEALGLCILIYKLERDKPPVPFALHRQQQNSRDSELEEPLPTGQRSAASSCQAPGLMSSQPSARESPLRRNPDSGNPLLAPPAFQQAC